MSLCVRVADKFLDAIELGPSFAMRHCSYAVGKRVHEAKVRGFRIQLRRRSPDAVMFRRIFRHGDWDFRRYPQAARVWAMYQDILRAGERPVVIDAGANIGAASLWFATQFPDASIVAVEPDPENAEICRLNTRDAAAVTVVEGAIGARRGSVTLSNPIGTNDAVRTTRSSSGTVPVRTIDDLAEDGRLFLVKVDIEGFESDLFSANTDWLTRVGVIMIEPHDWMFPGEYRSHSFLRALTEHRFELLICGENLICVR
jgi:FkbM family methyltransferase